MIRTPNAGDLRATSRAGRQNFVFFLRGYEVPQHFCRSDVFLLCLFFRPALVFFFDFFFVYRVTYRVTLSLPACLLLHVYLRCLAKRILYPLSSLFLSYNVSLFVTILYCLSLI